jgi:hypothetical protein
MPGHAVLCTSGRLPIFIVWGDEPSPRGRQPLHLDVELWTRSRERISLLSGDLEASVDGQALRQGSGHDPEARSPGALLEPAAPPFPTFFHLQAPEGEELRAREGSSIELTFRQTRRGRRPMAHVGIKAEAEAS